MSHLIKHFKEDLHLEQETPQQCQAHAPPLPIRPSARFQPLRSRS